MVGMHVGIRCLHSVLDVDQTHAARRGSQTLAEQYPAGTEMEPVSQTLHPAHVAWGSHPPPANPQKRSKDRLPTDSYVCIPGSCDLAYDHELSPLWTSRRLARSGRSVVRLLGCGSSKKTSIATL